MHYTNNIGILKPAKIAELLVPFLKGGDSLTLTNDLELQIKKDVDIVGCDNTTYSVKWQPKAAYTGNLAFEIELIDPVTGQSMPGNFNLCQADRYLQLWPEKGMIRVALFDTNILHDFLKKEWPKKKLNTRTQEVSNANRKFSQAINKLVPVVELLKICINSILIDFDTVKNNPLWEKYVKDNTSRRDYYVHGHKTIFERF